MSDSDKLKITNPSLLRRKINYAVIIIFLSFTLLVVRLAYLQLYKGNELGLRSETNSIRLRKITSPRGLIMDNSGRIIAENIPSFHAYYVPNRTRSYQQIKDDFVRIYRERSLEIPREILKTSLAPPFVTQRLDSLLSRQKLAVIETNSHLLPGVFIDVVPVRRYPYGDTIAHLIGYVGEISREELTSDISGHYSSGDFLGKFGLEKELEDFLRGQSGAEQAEVNAVGREVRVLEKLEPIAGYNVVLTIDMSLQQAVSGAMNGKAGAVVVMDPRNGDILAMVSSPSFDPNLFSQGISTQDWRKLASDPLHPLKNRAISGQYPPASTYKVIVAAAALEEGLLTPDTVYNCNGEYEIGNRKFRCWRSDGHGRVNMHRAIVESCDVYFYNLGKLIGVDMMAQYAQYFGLGQKTGIGLPQERKGLIPTKNWKKDRFKAPWHLGETISISIGQGYNLTTPLQLANLYAALANDGKLYRPRIVKKILHTDGRAYREYQPELLSQIPISAKTIRVINQALWGVVNEQGGTAAAARRHEKDLSGKTGTAQVVGIPRTGETLKYHASGRRLKDHAIFVGFAPADRPEILVSVLIEHAGAGGGAVAAPIAKKIVDAYFSMNQKNKQPARELTAKAGNR